MFINILKNYVLKFSKIDLVEETKVLNQDVSKPQNHIQLTEPA